MCGTTASCMRVVREHLSQYEPGTFQKTTSPTILCTRLPPHWRYNKSLPQHFIVLMMTPVPDGTKITVHAGNEETPCGEVRNATAEFKRQMAKFNDLRFVGKSGRGRNFHVTIVIHTNPITIAVVNRAVKITVDGPREARHPNKEATSRQTRRRVFSSTSPTSCQLTPLIYSPAFQSMFYHPYTVQGLFATPPALLNITPQQMILRSQSLPQPPTPVKRRREEEKTETPKTRIWRPYTQE